MSSGEDYIIIATAKGQGIHFKETEVRQMGRQASGVIGIRLKKDDYVVGMEVVFNGGHDILFATENGYGKRVCTENFRVAHRGGVGVRTIPTTGRNGLVVGLALIYPDSNILLIDKAGKIIRLAPKEIRTMGRQAKGVRLIRLDKGQKLANVVAFREDHEEETPTGDSGDSKPTEIKVKAATVTTSEVVQMNDEQPESTDPSIQSAEQITPAVAKAMVDRQDDRDKVVEAAPVQPVEPTMAQEVQETPEQETVLEVVEKPTEEKTDTSDGQKSLFGSSDELNVFEMASPTELPDLVIEEPGQDDDFFGEF